MSAIPANRSLQAQPLNAGGSRPAGELAQYLTFMLGGETFAIGILTIMEIIEYGTPTSVPMMPSCVRGIINLRGAVVPVMDLQARFGQPSSPVTKRSCIVIVEIETGDERQVVGVVVDAVNAVLEIPQTDIEPAPAFGTRVRADFIAGMGKVGGRFVLILNTGSVLPVNGIGDEAGMPAPPILEAFPHFAVSH